MQVQTYFPEHSLLKKYISYYYFMRNDADDFNVKYYSFPNTTTPLNIHKNVVTDIGYYSTSVTGSNVKNNVLLVQGMRTQPLLVKWKGKLDKITIHFKPLGLNQFIKKPFMDVAPGDSQLFTEWNNEQGFGDFMDSFYNTTDMQKRVTILEWFLLSIYKPLQLDTAMEKAVEMLTYFDHDMNINEVASQLGLNNKALHRFFHKHIGTSPVSFRKIARFRHSLQNKLVNEQQVKRLTDICYESNFYDQSYFINVYRQITGLSPTSFFKGISKLADNRLVVKMLN
jgi:AraC-like DNA-binding protein